jgi:putative transposase
MPKGLQRFHASGNAHFITCSCYHRQPFLSSARRRDLFLTILEDVRQKYQFIAWGYVVMPEHFHLLISEPTQRTVAVAMQVLKQRVSRRARRKKTTADQIALWQAELPPAFWQKRYYDFNVFSQRKHAEKLNYMHNNPVKRGLVESAGRWRWSSFRTYRFGEPGLGGYGFKCPTLCSERMKQNRALRKGWGTHFIVKDRRTGEGWATRPATIEWKHRMCRASDGHDK